MDKFIEILRNPSDVIVAAIITAVVMVMSAIIGAVAMVISTIVSTIITAKTNKQGKSSKYTKELDKEITPDFYFNDIHRTNNDIVEEERNKLLVEIMKFKIQPISADYKLIIEEAELSLEVGDTFSYQNILDKFLVLKKGKLREDKEKNTNEIANDKKNIASAHYFKAQEFKTRFEYEESLNHYRKAMLYQPDEALYLNELGFIYYTSGQHKRALECYEKVRIILIKKFLEGKSSPL